MNASLQIAPGIKGKYVIDRVIDEGRTCVVDVALHFVVCSVLALAAVGCREAPPSPLPPPPANVAPASAIAASSSEPVSPVPGGMRDREITNRFAYVPSQCWTKTRDERGRAHNACYACHVRSVAPNYIDDGDLQVRLTLPGGAAKNPWKNDREPPSARPPHASSADVLARVRESNYFDHDHHIVLARELAKLPPAWDGAKDGVWNGYVPDAWFAFDEHGFDHAPSGDLTGWRAVASYPFPGMFLPTNNGSLGDVLMRLDPALREDRDGHFDATIYTVNFAIVEALIKRADVPIDPVDEVALGVDLDLDGVLGKASRVAFDDSGDGRGTTRMHWVGRAREQERAGRFPIAVGLFPLGTEFFHSVRYLDVDEAGHVVMAARMKEVRYGKKTRWFSYPDLRAKAASETVEQTESADGSRTVLWEGDRGVYNGQGWLFQGFIEAKDGSLRPQGYEESAACVGCHGGIGVTTDSIFSFARKLPPESFARGWYHPSQRDLRGLAEPRRRGGQFEYSFYLASAGGADDLRENEEVAKHFFDGRGALRPGALRALHDDIATLVLPSPARAIELDRAYAAIVDEQSFARGRAATLAPAKNTYAIAPIGDATGIERPLVDATPKAAFAVTLVSGTSR